MPTITLQPRGPAGFEGYSVLSATPPRDPVRGDGKDGDFWLNQRSGGLFRRQSNAWRLQFSMLGTKGEKGDTGLSGNGVLSGTGAPGPLVGRDGDFYFQTAGAGAPIVYGPKASGSWPSGISLVGPLPFSAPAAWASGQTYTAQAPASAVLYQGSSYVCTTSHTSGGSFDASKWQLIASAGQDGAPGGVNTVGAPVVSGRLPVYSGTTGALISDSGLSASDVLIDEDAIALAIAYGG